MIDSTDSSGASGADRKGEADLEEARLRQQAIGVKLRHMFDEVVNEPVPDEFLEILKRADAKAALDGPA
ncbi:NepR family anti-sigma factor [uncultured Brevundimonas sp.]|uniref:anti-sigma T factor NepR n=1 Tax=uncultured Brevundimonas sp. TaxID=213418 RepID=UPI0025DC135E|nr:NepR family anti-sigma factor [uncultured Brevundimonas sp.]